VNKASGKKYRQRVRTKVRRKEKRLVALEE